MSISKDFNDVDEFGITKEQYVEMGAEETFVRGFNHNSLCGDEENKIGLALGRGFGAGIAWSKSANDWSFDVFTKPEFSADQEYMGFLGIFGYNYPDDEGPTFYVSVIEWDEGMWVAIDDNVAGYPICWKPITPLINPDVIFQAFKDRDLAV